VCGWAVIVDDKVFAFGEWFYACVVSGVIADKSRFGYG